MLDSHDGIGIPISRSALRNENAFSCSRDESDFRQRRFRDVLLFGHIIKLKIAISVLFCGHFTNPPHLPRNASPERGAVFCSYKTTMVAGASISLDGESSSLPR